MESLTDETSTIYTIQDELPGVIDRDGELIDYDQSYSYSGLDIKTDKNGCVPVYPDELDYYKEHGSLPPNYMRTDVSLEADIEFEKFVEESKKKSLPKETHDETVVQLVRK